MLDKFKDECGVFGIFGHPEAANLTYLGLYALQHRGQESAGIATADGEKMRVSRAMQMGLIRNHYVGRTFIQPQQAIRHFSVRIKLNPVRSVLDGKRVILVDDSIVRGTTSRKIVKMVRAAGAREVHMLPLASFPPAAVVKNVKAGSDPNFPLCAGK